MTNTKTYDYTDDLHTTVISPPADTLDELNQMLSEAKRELDSVSVKLHHTTCDRNHSQVLDDHMQITLWISRLERMVSNEMAVQRLITNT